MKLYKKIIMTAVAALCVIFASCHHDDNEVWHMWKITIQGENVVLGDVVLPVGSTLQLQLKIVPTFVNVIDPVWRSEDETIAIVSSDGLVTAMKSGDTYITVHSAYNPEINDRLRLRVSGSAVSIDDDDPVDQSEAEARQR